MKYLVLLIGAVFGASAYGGAIDLNTAKLKHITFDDLPTTNYSYNSGVLTMKVKKSASFLLKPLEQVTAVSRVAFEWKGLGQLKVKNAEDEKSKDGDDSRFRLGLILSGEAPTIPFFAPAWIKAIRDNMKLPSDQLLYMVVDTKNKPGTIWDSPYSDSMRLLSIASSPIEGGWMKVDHKFDRPYKVVGLWFMADGDNTESTFETLLRNLSIN